MGVVKGTRYLLKIRNHAPRATHHAPRKAENSVPPLFFEKAGDNKLPINYDKTSMTVGSRQRLHNNQTLEINIANNPIVSVNKQKLLGALMNICFGLLI